MDHHLCQAFWWPFVLTPGGPLGPTLCPRRWNKELFLSHVVVSGRSSYKCRSLHLLLYLGLFLMPQGALASLISWHLGQLQAGLSHHRALVTPLAAVQPNLWAFWAPLWIPLSWVPGLLPFSAVWPYMILRPGSQLLNKCLPDAFSLPGAKWLAVWSTPWSMATDGPVPCSSFALCYCHPCIAPCSQLESSFRWSFSPLGCDNTRQSLMDAWMIEYRLASAILKPE